LLDLRDEVRIDTLFDNYIEKFEDEYRTLLQKVLEISPDLESLSEKNIGLIKAQMNYLKEKAHRFHRRNHKQVTQDLTAVEAQLMPGGHLQERTLSILQYYAQSGDSLIDFLINEVPLDPDHRIIM
ncbi:MAG: bacillithiol biosynthesis BshC, partial [Acidaminobacter sp.]|uniref:bacillithiol biosynthesis protein BshC n=1 Tax=Acidaminobacter sp. TaxID=1872102 RepID=UPI00137FD547